MRVEIAVCGVVRIIPSLEYWVVSQYLRRVSAEIQLLEILQSASMVEREDVRKNVGELAHTIT